ncbi:actin cortical patch SUR7/pH-response regulator pali [Hygrophoropsis aurantiaca]|uniref:Actin cortical patch SUR7/pH-response regulator pali n=1 Tax=Hygrophoropsis aurantiaca TaxID=72124 RepID=A0ACB8AQB3_9AGAM|nr:actin cortical patch SUR7/pH-response regulator pali [Hygrophoropsis aurantiaca]
MRGEYCVGSATFLSLVAVLLLIFVHVGQINTSTVPHGVSMATVNTSGYAQALGDAFKVPIQGLYTDNTSAPLGERAGLRDQYDFGLYSYCAYVNTTAGQCSNQTVGMKFEPYTALTSDMFLNYSQYSDAIFVDTTFMDSSYLGYNAHVAYYFLLLGTIAAAIALITGLLKQTFAFFVSTGMSVVATLFILIGAAIWTAIVKKAEGINTFDVAQGIPCGVTVYYGIGIYLSWAAFACLAASIIPYMISCCTFRG